MRIAESIATAVGERTARPVEDWAGRFAYRSLPEGSVVAATGMPADGEVFHEERSMTASVGFGQGCELLVARLVPP